MAAVPPITVDDTLIDEIEARLDLREPNTLALRTIIWHLAAHQEAPDDETLEIVCDVATGVGKTYILAATIEYLATQGVRNFVVFVPRTAILTKTINNFTPGHPKSIVDSMSVRPEVITTDDLDRAMTTTVMDDPDTVKLYLLTVQSMLSPTSNVSRKTHEFRELLGDAFYEHLTAQQDLVVFADEHHTYTSERFSAAVRDLVPLALVGLTGTPDSSTPEEQIVYRYPLALAIADELVKTPVLVGRTDDLTDDATKLRDGVALLRAKQETADAYAQRTGELAQNLLMLVVTEDIEEAKRVEELLTSPSFYGGGYADKVLRVDSSQPEEALEALDQVEEPDSPHRIIVSVAMLKEGWDVATVAVITSLRPMVSELLSEQILGRGLRLPWGRYVDRRLLNQLDVVAHDSFERVLARANVLNEELVSWRTWVANQEERTAQQIARAPSLSDVTSPVSALAQRAADAETDETDDEDAWDLELEAYTSQDRRADAEADAEVAAERLTPREDLGNVAVPTVVTEAIESTYTLAELRAHARTRFVELGRRFAADPEDLLRRHEIVARVVEGADGLRRTVVTTAPSEETVRSDVEPPPLDEVRDHLRQTVLNSAVATGRVEDIEPAGDLVEALIEGAGGKAGALGVYLDRISGALHSELSEAVERLNAQPSVRRVVRLRPVDWVRGRAEFRTTERRGEFNRRMGYTGWRKSLYEEARFDSSTERAAAHIFDEDRRIAFWVRLQSGDLPINWAGEGRLRDYNPDFIVVEHPDANSSSGARRRCWIVEVKADRDVDDADVAAKFDAAASWASHVNASAETGRDHWDVLLVTETHIANARGSWEALVRAGRTALS